MNFDLVLHSIGTADTVLLVLIISSYLNLVVKSRTDLYQKEENKYISLNILQ